MFMSTEYNEGFTERLSYIKKKRKLVFCGKYILLEFPPLKTPLNNGPLPTLTNVIPPWSF